ncbi:MAG: hypothetical protein H0V82_04930 [Candidatus Protochlamydia sp.]|nr:hypothetical protein [Candidatus Protochlamydia sp.]
MPQRIQSFADSLHTSFHYPGKSSLDKGADLCLAPLRYLCYGRNFTAIPTLHQGNFFVKFEVNPIEKSFLKTAAAIVLIIPSLFLGSFLKFFSNFNSNLQWVLEQYRITPREATEVRPARNVYLMANINVTTTENEPIYWSELKNRYTNNATALQIKPWSLENRYALYDQPQSDLFCIYGRNPAGTTVVFARGEGYFEEAGEFFFQSRNIEKKTFILDYSLFESTDLKLNTAEQILRGHAQEGAGSRNGRIDFSPLLFDIPIELRCLRAFNSFGFEHSTPTVAAVR